MLLHFTSGRVLYEFISFIFNSNYVLIPFAGIIPSAHIAGIVREGKFAGHLITNSTQLVFMDEWTSDSLNCEDAKRILQGNLLK